MKKKITSFGVLCLLMFSSLNATQIIYVATPANGGDDANSGTISSPFATLAKATSTVSEDGAVVNLMNGTYVSSQTAVLNPYDQSIVGEDAASTIIDGNNSVSLIDGITSLQSTGKTVTIQKLSFKNAFLTVNPGVLDGGSAIRMGFKTNLNLEDCWFYKNTSSTTTIGFAGAVYFCGNNITVNRCFFEQNASNSTGTQAYGGALTVRHLFNLDNSATHLSGGATYAVVKNSTFYKNAAFSKGGAVYFNKQLDAKVDDDDATFVVQNCVFLENTSTTTAAAELGAAIAISSGSNSTNNKIQTIILTNNTICNNDMMLMPGNTVFGKNSVLLEGFRYTAYLANNLITSDATSGESIFANQPAPQEFGINNIIDKIHANIDGSDFNSNAVTQKNQLATITAATMGLNTTLVNYPFTSNFTLPYLTLATGSMAINGGADSYSINTIANPAPATPVEYILQSDIRGFSKQNSRDQGAYEFDNNTTFVSSPNNKGYVIMKCENGFIISGLNANDKLKVYDIRGCLVYNNSVNENQINIALSIKGIYLVSINNIVKKIQY
ncbi:MAG: hypothetical protein PHS59_15695 [Paludibacter sp.]|nr:hypothetical protein [Paludibacter sp.]